MSTYPLKPFESCLEKITYTTKIQRKDFLESGGFPVISQETEFMNGYWNNENDLFRIKKPVVIFGDHTQVLKYVDFDFILGADGVKILQPKDSLDTRFFYYFLQSIDLGSLGYARHYRLLKELQIPIPPLPEQLRIVSILDETLAKLDQAKENTEKNLQDAKEIFESYLQSIFMNPSNNWQSDELGNLGVITSSKRIFKSEYVKTGIPFYRTKEIKEISNGKEISLELFISSERYLEIKNYFGVPQIGDLLLSAVGTIGEIMVIENNNEFYFKDGNILWFKDFKTLNVNYLKFALTAFVEKIKSLAIGAAYSALTIEKLNKYKIYFPKDIEEQLSIVSQLNTLSTETKRLESIYQQKLVHLDELRKSLLQKAFNGEL